MLRVAIDFTFEDVEWIKEIIFCLYDRQALAVFTAEFERQLDELESEG